ncbi:MAG: MraY family glycosyltransferase [Bacillota bacterium]
MRLATALLFPGLATLALILLLRSMQAFQTRLADHPNERSLHDRPTPRVGGLAMMLATLPLVAWMAPAILPIVAVAAVLAAVSFADDLRSLPVVVRLAAHFAASAAIVAFMWLSGARIAAPIALAWVLGIAWMTNLFNFMDGADGLAGGMSAIGFGAFAIGARAAGADDLAFACAALASASVGFLAFNFPPAKIFLGDAGSIPLGFLAGALALEGVKIGAWNAAFALIVFLPFMADATATLAKRAARGARLWRAHREHYYQRLILSGWSRRRLAGVAYACMLACAASALALRSQGEAVQWVILAVGSALFIALFAAIDHGFVTSASTRKREPR